MNGADYHNNEGRKKIQQFGKTLKGGRWDWHPLLHAVINYYDGLKQDPNHGHLWLNVAYALHLTGLSDAAHKCLTKGLSLNPAGSHTEKVANRISTNYPFSDGVIRVSCDESLNNEIRDYCAKILGLMERKEVFIVYGHDAASLDQLELTLRRIGAEPLRFDRIPPGGAETIVELLEKYLARSHAIVCLLTPDDEGRKRGTEDALEPRARQNALIEAGYAILGRRSQSVLVALGGVSIPSDFDGIYRVQDKHWSSNVARQVASRLRAIGLDVDEAEA